MKLKLRVRINDVKQPSAERGEFIHFDNCVQVEIGKRIEYIFDIYKKDQNNNYVHEEYFKYLNSINYFNKKDLKVRVPGRSEYFEEINYMVRDYYITEQRIKMEIEDNEKREFKKAIKSPFHLNIIIWKDRLSSKWHKLVFDTVCFLQNDQGDTLERIQG